jgi:hypothetical protein
MTIQLKPEQERVIGEAIRAGLLENAEGIVDVGVEAIRLRLEDGRGAEQLSADEWIRRFREWANSHSRDTPLLSDEAISRDSIYDDRGM